MSPDSERVRQMAAERGYSLPYHRILDEHDPDALDVVNDLVRGVYLRQRRLSREVKELIQIVTLTALGADQAHVARHVRVAIELGVPAQDILEALEMLLTEAGIITFSRGVAAWEAGVADAAANSSAESAGDASEG